MLWQVVHKNFKKVGGKNAEKNEYEIYRTKDV